MLATGEVKCIDEEIPFEIPQGWEWCRIRNISQSYIGLTYCPSEVSPQGTIVLRSSNIQDGKIVLDDIVRVTKNISEKLQVEKNDIIICARNGSAKLVGKSAIVTEITEPMTFGAFMAICKTSLYQYVSIFLQSDLFFSQLRDVSGTTTINQLTQSNFNGFLIAIPPLEEQHRIFEKINDVLPIVEIYGNKQEQLNKLNDNLRENVKKSILQEAIQGKLVQQIAEEGTAQDLLEQIKAEKLNLVKKGKLKKSALATSIIYKGDDNKYYEQIGSEVTEIELPFDFPSSWSIVRLYAVCQLTDGLKTTGKQCLLDAKYLRGKSSGTIIEQGKLVYKGDNIMLVDGENSGEVFIVPQDGYMGSTFKQLWISSSMYEPYILAFIQFYKETLRNSKKGAAIPHLNKELFYGLIIGIPPFQEQKRIVQKIELSAQLLK
ncbi:restriction endonuclease subunit S [Phocaeicola dorei]|nr:restriction endonuclease subunit S [Phocaeicola dorei]